MKNILNFFCVLVGLMAVLFLFSLPCKADEYREYQKQMLRLSYTEFCSTVGKPPAIVAEALNKAMEQDPKTWLPAVLWWNKIAEKYNEAKCGDA